MKKEYSIYKLFFITILITLVLLTSAAAGYAAYSFSVYSNQLVKSNETYLSEYTSMLQGELEEISTNIRSLVYSDPSFQLLVFANYPDSKRIPVNYTMREIIEGFTPPYGITLLHDSRSDSSYFSIGRSLFSTDSYVRQQQFLKQLRVSINKGEIGAEDSWIIVMDGEYPYLAYISSQNGVSLSAIIDFSAYMESNIPPSSSEESRMIVFSGDTVFVNGEVLEEQGLSLSDIRSGSFGVESFFRKHHLVQAVSLPEYPVGIAVVTPFSALIRIILPQLLFFLFLVLLVVIILLVMYQTMKKLLLFPLREISDFTRKLEENAPVEDDESGKTRVLEFNEIRSGLLQLLDKQSELEAERQNKEQAREHAVLQYYQLQTRSHFFLNCLKSLYNMSESQQIAKMQAMILAFSNHLRYIFHDNLMTVTMEAELREVTDYHRIILLDYSRIFILTQNVPAEFMQVEVPPLLIQTFLENTYKYNSKSGEPLVFEVRASRAEENGKAFMKLELFDNGNGYSEEVLQKINEELSGSYDQFNVGINNLRRRLSIIFRNECRTEFYNRPEGGACSVIYIPLQKEDV